MKRRVFIGGTVAAMTMAAVGINIGSGYVIYPPVAINEADIGYIEQFVEYCNINHEPIRRQLAICRQCGITPKTQFELKIAICDMFVVGDNELLRDPLFADVRVNCANFLKTALA